MQLYCYILQLHYIYNYIDTIINCMINQIEPKSESKYSRFEIYLSLSQNKYKLYIINYFDDSFSNIRNIKDATTLNDCLCNLYFKDKYNF